MFDAHRPYLASVAYRLLGSVADADDVLQDAWLRWRTVDHGTVEDPRAYLTRTVTRLCYDLLRSARVRREAYVGEWLPEPAVVEEVSPAERAVVGEEVSLAMLAVLEKLTPAERTAFVLHDVFAVDFAEIATALDRSPEAVRQLASRARRRVGEQSGRSRPVDPAEHRRAVAAFTAAAVGGDMGALVSVLAPDVVWHSDGGGVVSAAVRPIFGADKVARTVLGLGAKFVATGEATLAPALVNGEPGLITRDAEGRLSGVMGFAVADGRITEMYIVLNPEKLRHLEA
ncbi:RNA polymerase sigma factor SigJ [Streptomyces durbertensis]|uniref:RNA polymerase sigma factor SigJ n=1 Tax=Streptomyces durbertensis TaxID=2448886 RepID=A0ABR6EHP1_9ACTN|nr:RNA polymerase sigma factor SigJ [Streptomyces durbertensis]